jgi:hypothetical protein
MNKNTHLIHFCLLVCMANIACSAPNKKTIQTQVQSDKRTEQIKALQALIVLVKKGQCLDEALTVAQNLSHSTDPLIQDIVYDLNSAIAQWCITTIEAIFS